MGWCIPGTMWASSPTRWFVRHTGGEYPPAMEFQLFTIESQILRWNFSFSRWNLRFCDGISESRGGSSNFCCGIPASRVRTSEFHVEALILATEAQILAAEAQNFKLPRQIHLPLLRSKSMMSSPDTLSGTSAPMVNSELPKITPVSRKSPTRTLMVDSMPVGMAP